MRLVDLSMTVEECDSAPFAPDEKYFKLKPIIKWEDKGFVSNVVEMTVHAGTHIDSPHHFFRDKPSIEQLPLEPMMDQLCRRTYTAYTNWFEEPIFGFEEPICFFALTQPICHPYSTGLRLSFPAGPARVRAHALVLAGNFLILLGHPRT